MASERGLLIEDAVVPGTDRIIRDSAAWWEVGERGTIRRAPVMDIALFHWSAGEAGLRDPDGPSGPLDEYDDDGRRLVAAMKDRRREDGSPMSVAIQFSIGACDPDDDWANCWQHCDIGRVACIHVSKLWNPRAIGTEIISAGMPDKPGGPRFDLRNRPQIVVPLIGARRRTLAFYRGQIRTAVWLAETLAALHGRGGIQIPRQVPASLATRRLTPCEAARWRGGAEHCLSPSTTKLDAGGQIMSALVDDAGWARAAA